MPLSPRSTNWVARAADHCPARFQEASRATDAELEAAAKQLQLEATRAATAEYGNFDIILDHCPKIGSASATCSRPVLPQLTTRTMASSEQTWECPACTCRNPDLFLVCHCCGGARAPGQVYPMFQQNRTGARTRTLHVLLVIGHRHGQDSDEAVRAAEGAVRTAAAASGYAIVDFRHTYPAQARCGDQSLENDAARFAEDLGDT